MSPKRITVSFKVLEIQIKKWTGGNLPPPPVAGIRVNPNPNNRLQLEYLQVMLVKSNARLWYLELVFKPTEAFEFHTQLERGEYWVVARERNQRRTGKCAVRVDTRARVL